MTKSTSFFIWYLLVILETFRSVNEKCIFANVSMALVPADRQLSDPVSESVTTSGITDHFCCSITVICSLYVHCVFTLIIVQDE